MNVIARNSVGCCTADVELRWHRRVHYDSASQLLRDAVDPLTAARGEWPTT